MGSLANTFLSAADRLHLTSANCAARKIHKVMKPVGRATNKYRTLETGGAREFYGRMGEALMAQGWPADSYYKAPSGQLTLDGTLGSIIWELSVTLTDLFSGTGEIRQTLEDRLNGSRKDTKEAMEFVIAHLDDVTKALQSVTSELKRECKQPGGIVLRHCGSLGKKPASTAGNNIK